MRRDFSRRDEGSLLLFTLLILASGSLLLFLAKTRAGIPADSLDVNTASANRFAQALQVDPSIGRRLTTARERLGEFRYAKQIAEVRLFTPNEAAGAAAALTDKRVDLNEASRGELQRAMNISAALARRLTEFRENLPTGRSFQRSDLSKVPLLNPKTVDLAGERLIARGMRDVALRFGVTILLLGTAIVLIPAALRKRGLRPDPLLLPLFFILSVMGLFAQFTLRDPFRDSLVYGHHAGGLLLGLAALLFGAAIPGAPGSSSASRVNFRRYTYVWALGAVLLILLLLLFGTGPGGVKLSLWFFQPIEAVKLLLVLFLAGYLADRAGLLADSVHRWRLPLKFMPSISSPRREDFAPLAAMFGFALLLFAAARDLGPALVCFGAFLALFYIATGRGAIVGLGLLLIVAGTLLAYRLRIGVIPVRVEMWLSPWSNPHANGVQLGQSYWALSSGGFWGTGLGLGMPGLLARGRDDLVFSVLGEELGLIGSISILVLYCLLITRGLRVSGTAQNDFDRMLAAGITALFGCQIFVVLAGVTGLLPLSGITLPLLGYGNSALVVNLFAAGLLVGISHKSGTTESPGIGLAGRRPIRVTAMAAAAGILGLVGLGRVAFLQLLRDTETAGRQVRTPDSDGVVRAKTNPRLLAVERQIPRGSIYDRNGRTLATYRRTGPGRRHYPYGEATAHLVGYLDPAVGGPVGMEREYNSALRGFRRYQELVRGYRDKDIPRLLRFTRDRVGSDVHLTIDAELQNKAYQVLRVRSAALKDRRSGRPKNRASMVVVDPVTGEVIIAASLPSFDPNTLTREKWREMLTDRHKEARLFDRARSGAYPPGSSLKVATAAAAMEAGVDPVYTCAHVAERLRWRYAGRTYVRDRLSDDQGDAPHGRVTLSEGLRHSCNLFFARLGIELGTDRLQTAYSDQFGLRYTRDGRAFARDLPLNAIGQGTMLASPMEMARIAGTVANKGRTMQARFIKTIREPGGRVVYSGSPVSIARPLGETNAERLAELMRSVVTGGTARGVFDALPVEVAGKTGTAETEEGDRLPHSWFIGFTPFSDPKFAFACIIENGGYGKRGAAPAVYDVLRSIFMK